ncbi:MAG TPA: helix-turn-helix transcriptional regulator [Novimethylophilus sp.]|uniref:helix-turn-helix domain-containing protein n=1 Tax=Novimethylophilus sp. TaxID=2137426 RepID=UPI002F40FCC0
MPKLSEKSGVPKRTIYSILAKDRVPGIDTTDELAKAFGLNGWLLLYPNLNYELAKSGKLDMLIETYGGSQQETREYVTHVLNRERAINRG